jgi:hypothetical protein
MGINFLKNLIARFAGIALIAAVTVILSVSGSANNIARPSVVKKIAGVWQLKRTVNEKPATRSKAFLPVRETPQSLVLAVEDGVNEITINEGFREFIQTQTLPTDGRIVTQNVQRVGQVSATALWKKDRLIVEVTTSGGDKLVETFDLTADQKQLRVTLHFTAAGSTRTIKVRRIYERAGSMDESDTAQLGITVYPL